MKRFLYTGILATLLFSSCEKVIDVDLNTAPNQIVIEGNITDQRELQTVKISQSVPYTDQNVYPAVKGAQVVVTDNTGNTWAFIESQPGLYTFGPVKGIAGRTYSLKVNINDKIYTANSEMPAHVALDSLSLTVLSFGGEDIKQIQVNYKDPAAVVNQYRWIMKINGVQTKRVFTSNDRFTDGNPVAETLYYDKDDDNKELQTGDAVEVEMQCIDKNIFTYWDTLSQQTQNGPGGGVTPGNPPSNIDNNALGYFSAHTTETMSSTVK